MFAGEKNYISGVSTDSHTRAIQLWQFLGCKILFRLSLLSKNKEICDKCGIHSKYPFDIPCKKAKPKRYTLSEYPVINVLNEYSFKTVNGCHQFVFNKN